LKTVDKYHFIVNRTANRGRAGSILPILEEKLRVSGTPHQIHLTGSAGDATNIAARLPDGACVVAVGGDGTINEIINGIYGRNCSLSIIPAGSGNDFAKMFPLKNKVSELVDNLTGWQTRLIDVGYIELQCKSGKETKRYFANAVGIGLDAMVTHINSKFTVLRGFSAYMAAALKAIATYRPPESVIRVGNKEWTGKKLLIAVGNGTTVGGGFKLTPNAKLDDGLLDVCWAKSMPIRRIARILPTVLKGNHLKFPEVISMRAKSITVESEAGMPVHIDGEMMGLDVTRVTISIADKQIIYSG
jgi:YegS/Rv2252/BmrU family lipid kinase